MANENSSRHRTARAHGAPDEFRALGHHLVDQIGGLLTRLADRPVRAERAAHRIRELLAADPFPERGLPPQVVFDRALALLSDHAISTAHPRFWAYIMGAASPLAALADFLASAFNPPVTSYPTCAITVAMEAQTVRWVAELLGFPVDCGGLFLNGGSMGNLVALRAALQVKAGWDVRTEGVTGPGGAQLRLYTSKDSHSSITSAANVCGLGSRAVRQVPVDGSGRMRPEELERMLLADEQAGLRPFMVIATAGTTSTGAVDPLSELGAICRKRGLWFHVDGAYGGFAVLSSEAPPELGELRQADSLVVDPHKWLYMPADIGCLLTRDRRVLYDTYHQGAPYYAESDEQSLLGGPETLQFRDLGPQTTRSLRALKVRLFLQSVGREGYAKMLDEDIRLARRLYELAARAPTLEALSHHLSITTFRYVPGDLAADAAHHRGYLDALNKELLHQLQDSGVACPSHTTIRGVFALRVCIVNYNTTLADIEALPEVVNRLGAETDARLRPAHL